MCAVHAQSPYSMPSPAPTISAFSGGLKLSHLVFAAVTPEILTKTHHLAGILLISERRGLSVTYQHDFTEILNYAQ